MGTGGNQPVVDCGAPFLTLLNHTLADFDTEISHLSSFELALCRVDGEVVVPEDCKNLGRIVPEFFESVCCDKYVVDINKDMSGGDEHLEDGIHELLEDGGDVGNSEGHDLT